ncbi:hypothetical protein BKA67DRAFT_588326 [Truncatella angustata]|uniref:DUF7907 domain-containing protein n=1 Tax=Truncatella angustata TaxID=152316 RepID=A0A9P8RK09_9PEZI|nr:uncharacterized protein BKA67DRAFT_588326 [Truncatella angustata]KAH6640031.1 hypothetical protein BKA67DRAFT_588326 [Truncatella angustata]KAH8200526.1 hypothetical protein TruAng_005303 [Truncatella angustata]
MISKYFPLAMLASLVAASPLKERASYPPISQSSGFTLVANVTDTSKPIFDPPVNGWSLVGTHVGAGQSTAVLSPGVGSVFFVNGTGQQVSSASTSVGLPPLTSTNIDGNPYYIPMGLQFSTNAEGNEVYVGLNVGLGTSGAGIIPGLRSPYAELFGPYGGTFAVCNESEPAYGRPQYAVRLEVDGVQANCVAINLLAQCAELPALNGVDELDIIVEDVKCYENVAAIDWSQY